ncbi:coiled-coil domain-containing protein 92 [Pundamilia nyererei]|uniref:Coiled-coil domain-containing protein 92 n=1 Tax=Pundamilia nyererei TaxID=303518 RepID=A0A9Y3R8B4_9CICH|nr:PREDICTED: coiled-coil domain-containing protein 92 [Pundamilia nyererei]XP_005729625.1 PREDICTED: coiled-coil domain-containing protein 92 [Pundamilia nyererei]XP_005729626.1 PREDICTED: coiled-coil domain-containing protein 92 [Pundamilia nyererei]XP_013765393.1 PREDICTED: coiled-coil domain-containing protein 92 [Pundamilia nyererei]
MASANVTMENQLQSAQKNLLFLQQDHANTLKGLHAEIRRLQQQCTDLTYELTIRSSDPSDSSEARCRELQRRCEELEAQLKKKEEENTELLRDLEQKNAMISVLENTIKEREKKYLEELKMKSHKLAVLSGELEQRASTIAYLTSQLHATKKKLLASSSSEASPNASPVTSYKPTPPPAKDRQPETPRRRMKKSLSQPLHPELTEVYRLGADGRRMVLRETVDAMPDPTPFLQAGRESPEPQVVRERPAVIPPIAPERSHATPLGATASPRHSPARDRQYRAHVGVAHRIPHGTPPLAPPQADVETLAVDQVNEEKVVRKRSGADRTV